MHAFIASMIRASVVEQLSTRGVKLAFPKNRYR
jgi:hypothetical protein